MHLPLDGERGRRSERHSGLRGHRPTHLQSRPGGGRGSDDYSDARDRARPFRRPAGRHGRADGDRGAACSSSRTRRTPTARAIAAVPQVRSATPARVRFSRARTSRPVRGASSRPTTSRSPPPAARCTTAADRDGPVVRALRHLRQLPARRVSGAVLNAQLDFVEQPDARGDQPVGRRRGKGLSRVREGALC